MAQVLAALPWVQNDVCGSRCSEFPPTRISKKISSGFTVRHSALVLVCFRCPSVSLTSSVLSLLQMVFGPVVWTGGDTGMKYLFATPPESPIPLN